MTPVSATAVQDGENAYFAADLPGFSERLRELLDGRLPDLSRAERQKALQRDIPAVGRQLAGIYRRLLSPDPVESL